MKRNLFITRALIGLLVMVMVPFGAFGQDAGTAGTFSPQELDQMLAPIALYPGFAARTGPHRGDLPGPGCGSGPLDEGKPEP